MEWEENTVKKLKKRFARKSLNLRLLKRLRK